jgi:hypothetical protein
MSASVRCEKKSDDCEWETTKQHECKQEDLPFLKYDKNNS